MPSPSGLLSSSFRQRATLISLDLPLQDDIDLQLLDEWLQHALSLEFGTYDQRCSSTPESIISVFVERTIHFQSILLQLGGIPVFDIGHVVRVNKAKAPASSWIIDVAVVTIEQIPKQCFSFALEFAIKMLKWCSVTPRTEENVSLLYATIEKKFKPKLQKMFVSGKSTIPVLRVAHRLNIPFIHLGSGIYQFGWGYKSRRMDRSTTDADSAMGAKLSQHKVRSASLIRMAGLPAPIHGVVSSLKAANDIARKLSWPVVVKPADRDRGEGVAVGVRDEAKLKEAFECAYKLSRSKQVIVEREVPGVCHRLFIFNGRLLYAVKRLPKSICGNGVQTIIELIAEANRLEASKPPWLKSEKFPDDELAVMTISGAGFSMQSVPEDGVWVPLRVIESTESGGRDEDFTELVHPDNLDIALRAASLFGLDVVGVDIISPDIQVPWHENGAIINEINFAPLFGGAEISRSYIPKFFSRLMDGDGRIPVDVIVGDAAAMAKGLEQQQELLKGGTRCFLSSHQLTLDSAGREIIFPFHGLFHRCRALLLDNRVEAIVLVIQTDEILSSGMPIDRIDKLTNIGEMIYSSKNSQSLSSANKLISYLKNYVIQ